MKVVEEVIVSRLRPRLALEMKMRVGCCDDLLWCVGPLAVRSHARQTVVAAPRDEFSSSALAGRPTDWQIMQ